MIKSSPVSLAAGVTALSLVLSISSVAGAAPLTPQQTPTPPPAAADTNTTTSGAPAPVIRAVTVTGAHGLPSSVLAAAAAREAFGKPGTPDIVHAAVESVIRTYRDKGYPVAEVIGTEVSSDGVLRITVAEGTIRRIIVKGNHKTRRITILEAMGLQPGGIYQEGKAKDDRNRLARLGIFSDVVIAPVAPGSVSEKDDEDKPASKSDSDKDGKDDSSPDASSDKSGDKSGDGSGKKDSDTPTVPGPTAPPLGTSKGTEEVPSVQPQAPVPTATPAPENPATPPVAMTPTPPDEDTVGMVDVVVKVKEERTGNVAATVGYSDGTGLTGFVDLTEANFQGAAQQISLQWQRSGGYYYDSQGNQISSQSRQAFDISFVQPLVNPHALAYSVDLYNKQTVFLPFFASYNDTIRNYEIRKGATLRVGRAVARNSVLYLSARRDEVGYDTLEIPVSLFPPENLIDNSNATVGALGLNLVVDGRNDIDNPRHGFLDSLVYEQAGNFLGGDRSFSQARIDLRQYFALTGATKGPILATRLLGGTSFGNNIPLSEYYFIGGYDLLRGYDLYSIYGDRMVLGSVEVRTPISDSVQGVAFVDAGNAYLPGTPVNSVKIGEGLGLRFLSPIGPIRLDVAHGNSDIQTYVSLGQSF